MINVMLLADLWQLLIKKKEGGFGEKPLEIGVIERFYNEYFSWLF